jgi:hypothetical protein
MVARYILELYGSLSQNGSNNSSIFIIPSGAGANGIPNSFSIDLSTLNTISSAKTQGITINCGNAPGMDITYDYTNFNVSFTNNCSNSGKSFAVFTPKSGITGTQELGNGTNLDGGINEPFAITSIENQNGDFYLVPYCDTDSLSRNILLTALDNTILPA